MTTIDRLMLTMVLGIELGRLLADLTRSLS